MSSFYSSGIFLILLGLIPISIGIAMFLPTATEAIVRIAPKGQRGLSMAIYSQCFGISFLVFPLIAGTIIDNQGNAMTVSYTHLTLPTTPYV